MSKDRLSPPRPRNLKAYAFEALSWVNEQRTVRGLEPLDELLPGRRRSWTFCPVARSLAEGSDDYVRACTWEVTYRDGPDDEEPWHTVRPPTMVRNFIEAFDTEEAYADLVWEPVLAFTGGS